MCIFKLVNIVAAASLILTSISRHSRTVAILVTAGVTTILNIVFDTEFIATVISYL